MMMMTLMIVIQLYISKEQLEQIFSEFGEVCSVYYPIDLKTRTHRGFAFIRYGHEGEWDGIRAMMVMVIMVEVIMVMEEVTMLMVMVVKVMM